ncbi:hypothetical protein [Pseudaestuariivita atlantica]|uniref:Oxidoreductase n=1 Tax=Pseudaestuariivita atlantica TaxID=1317121 RepID=A0A0L1JNN3_9RHOB|nr:hypothetical protein [Pseudaestuariivita atlantica]KNG93366.1 hypothetical protein ATO11_13075 [Pseudaestuariivita atlantica]
MEFTDTLPEDLLPLTEAESRVVAEASKGSRITLGDGSLPIEDAEDVTVRAAFLRALLTAPVSTLGSKGLRLRGAWVTGVLDLQGADFDHDISISACHLAESVELVNARVRGLYISGSRLAGLHCDGAHLDGALFLRGGTAIAGEISLAGARVGGDVQLCDLTITAPGQDAVFAQGVQVDGSLYLGNYPYSEEVTSLTCDGALFLSSAQVSGDVFITNCAVTPMEGAASAVFAETEEHGPGIAVSLARARVAGLLYFADNQITRGLLNLAGATVARLRDEPAAPGATYPIRLDGFRYEDFSRHTSTDVGDRLAWLARHPEGLPFVAQPYEQLASVLRRLGHRSDARMVLKEKEHLLRRDARAIAVARGGYGLRWAGMAVGDAMMRYGVGYGYRPGRVVIWALALILALGVFFDTVWRAGDMAPNAAPVLVSRGWQEAVATHPDNPAEHWSSPGQPGQDWETFNAYAYAADLVVPLVSFGQEAAWAPTTANPDSLWGRTGWWLRWFAKVVGWIVTALGAAAITGAVRSD